MTVEEAVSVFDNIPVINRQLQILSDVGLGYIRLGQPAPTLSGGEAQRVKLARELSKRPTGRTLYLLDEPTTGLHFDDINKLIEVLDRLVEGGNTVVVVEHNMDVIKVADYIIDLGPEGGDKGGELVASGTPEEIAAAARSYTGRYLKKVLAGHSAPGRDEMKPGLKTKLEMLPAEPGVYVFRNAAGGVIYVGKAKALTNRVRSYFQAPSPGDHKGQALRGEIADLEVTVCQTEVDALILEATLIKRYKPRYNVILRDDKSYPYIAVTMSDEFPRVSLMRGKRVRGVRYYGPYVNARAARNTISLLQKVFPLRHCTGRLPGRKGSSPCLYFEMHMCLGPCRGNVDAAEYSRHVMQFRDFLEGRHSEVLSELETHMRAAAREQEYEEAARIRNQIDSAKKVLRHHRALSSLHLRLRRAGGGQRRHEGELLGGPEQGRVPHGQPLLLH